MSIAIFRYGDSGSIFCRQGRNAKGRFMEYEIDVSRLRRDMKDYYGSAMFNGFPIVVIDISKIESMSDFELVELAQKNGVDMRKYIKVLPEAL